MTIDEIRELLSHAGSLGIGMVVGGVVVYLIVKNFLPSYLIEKGKNLATREDVGAITKEIEDVKHQYAQQLQQLVHQNSLLIEEMRSRGQLRLAAAEQRLRAHQEAFRLWRKLASNMHEQAIFETVRECQEWWNSNCLYLSAGAREILSNLVYAS
jgi:hypothetical protein